MSKQISLRDFVKASLSEIALGITDANAAVSKPTGRAPFTLRACIGDDSKIPGISFDVSVCATEQRSQTAGFMITLVNIGGGASSGQTKETEASHRIRFEVGLTRDVI